MSYHWGHDPVTLHDSRALGHHDPVLEEEGSVVAAACPEEAAASGAEPCRPSEQQPCVETFQEGGSRPAGKCREAVEADLEVSSRAEGAATSSAGHPWTGEAAPLLDGVEAPAEVASGDEAPPLGAAAAAAPGDGR